MDCVYNLIFFGKWHTYYLHIMCSLVFSHSPLYSMKSSSLITMTLSGGTDELPLYSLFRIKSSIVPNNCSTPNTGFFNVFEKPQAPKNSTIFQAKTQRTGSDSSQVNFKTHSIFCIFAINEPKPGKFARSAPKKCYVWYFLSKFPAKNSHFSNI